MARLLAYGASNKQIAQKLDVSDFTVRDHVSCLLKKFGVDSRARLAVVLSSGFVVGQSLSAEMITDPLHPSGLFCW